MKIGLDIHGVIDKYPDVFSDLSESWTEMGHEIHIITGQSWKRAREKVENAKISFHSHYSIVDYHRAHEDVDMWTDSTGNWWMPVEEWNKSKGVYCKESNIDIHFDDELQYAEYMPDTCTFVLVSKDSFLMPKLFQTRT